MNTQNVTTKNFNSKLAGAVRSIKTVRENIQLLTEFAVAYLVASPDMNCLYLSKIRNSIKTVHGLNVASFEAYVEERVNVKRSKNKHGEFIFRVDGNEVVETPVARYWYEAKPSDKKATPKKTEHDIKSQLLKNAESPNYTLDAHAAAELLAAYMSTAQFKDAKKKRASQLRTAADADKAAEKAARGTKSKSK